MWLLGLDLCVHLFRVFQRTPLFSLDFVFWPAHCKLRSIMEVLEIGFFLNFFPKTIKIVYPALKQAHTRMSVNFTHQKQPDQLWRTQL